MSLAIPLWLVGCGNMGGALLRAWVAAGFDPGQIRVIDPAARDVPAGVPVMSAPPVGEKARVLVLAIKPQLLDTVAPALAGAVGPDTILLSILAGVDVASLKQRFPDAGAIIRLMPNLAAAVGQGVTLLHASADSDGDARAIAENLAGAAGSIEWLEDEALFHAGTALSGCGPAFLFRFIEAMADAGAALGLPADVASRLSAATVLGSAIYADRAEDTPALLADRVASPGGATREGLNVLDEPDGIRPLLNRTLAAAAERSRVMAEAAR